MELLSMQDLVIKKVIKAIEEDIKHDITQLGKLKQILHQQIAR